MAEMLSSTFSTQVLRAKPLSAEKKVKKIFQATGNDKNRPTGHRPTGRVALYSFYAVILHNQRLVSSPEDVREGGNSVLYIGFYLPELKMADLTNCNAASHTQWTFQKKTA